MSALFIMLTLIVVLAVAWHRLWWAVIALIALTPTYLVRFGLVGVPTTLLEASIYAVTAVWFVRLTQRQIYLTSIPTFWRWMAALWLSISLIATLISPDAREALGAWKAYFFDAVVFFILFVTTVTDRYKIFRALWVAGSVVLVLALVAVWQSLGLISSPEPWISQSPSRVASVFEYPNALGLFVVPIVGLFLPWVFGIGAGSRRRCFAWAVVIAGTLAAVLAVSQGAWFGIAAAAAVTAWYAPRRRTLFVIAGVAVVAVLIVPMLRTPLFDLLTFHDTSGDVRLRLWQGTIRLLQHNPIVGAGLSGFPQLYDVYRDAAHVELLLYPHNIFLNFWVTLGLGGLVLAIVILVRILSQLIRRISDPESNTVRIGLLAAMTSLVVHGLVDVPYFKNDLAIIFWFIIALTVVLTRISENKNF